jgi:hypothetical protein
MARLIRILQRHRLTWDVLLPFERQMLIAIALFAVMAPLAAWEIDAIRALPAEPMGAFVLGLNLGAMTGVGLGIRERRRRQISRRTCPE